MKKSIAIAVIAAAGILPFSAQAQMKPEDAIKLRQSAMKLIGYNFSSIGAMVNDKKPYNKDEAIRNAARVDVLAHQSPEFFIAGSDKGETKAKPEIWKETEKFKAASDKLQAESEKLAAVAKSGDLAALKTAFGAAAQSCKGCHDSYRAQ